MFSLLHQIFYTCIIFASCPYNFTFCKFSGLSSQKRNTFINDTIIVPLNYKLTSNTWIAWVSPATNHQPKKRDGGIDLAYQEDISLLKHDGIHWDTLPTLITPGPVVKSTITQKSHNRKCSDSGKEVLCLPTRYRTLTNQGSV